MKVARYTEDGTSNYGYNHFDLLCMERDPQGNTTKYAYDRALNLVGIVRPNHAVTTFGREARISIRYDAFHHRTAQTDETGAVYATLLDEEGRVVKEISPNAWDPRSRDGEGVAHAYDGNGHRCRTQYPDGGIEH